MKYLKVNKVKPVKQTDYLQMLDEAMKYAKVQESKPMLAVKELPIRTHNKGVQDAD